MTNFAGPGAITIVQASIEYNAGNNAAPYFDNHQIWHLPALPEDIFGQSSHVTIIRQVNRKLIPGPEQVAQRQILPIQVNGFANNPRLGVNQTRRTNANAKQRPSGGGNKPVA